VAIKRVLPSFSEDAHFSTMFINEARLSAILRQPNIVQVLDFDRDVEGRLFLVMELVEGKDLSDIIETGTMPIPIVIHAITEALKGLAHAHEMTTPEGKPLGIVHRDISPHNVLVSWDGAVKVSDFGIAKAMLASGAGQSGMIKGKPLYMSPEQVTAPDTVDHRADLFAIGVMLFEMLTGQRVYQGATHEEVLTDVIQVAKGWRQLIPPSQLRPDVPWDVAQVAMMLLAPDRQHRFASARDAIDALHQVQCATPRGGDLLADLLLERFPGQAPPRVARRSGVRPGIVAGPQGATWVVTPPPQGGIASGTPDVRAQMAAPTRTITPAQAAESSPRQTQTMPERPLAMPGRSRAPWIAVLLVVAVAGIVIAVLATRGRNSDTSPSGARAYDAAAGSTLDAGAMKAAADASVPVAIDAAPAAPPDAATRAPKPDAGTGKPHRPKPGKGSDSGSSTGIHEIDIGDGP
jgi:hypothetical protein